MDKRKQLEKARYLVSVGGAIWGGIVTYIVVKISWIYRAIHITGILFLLSYILFLVFMFLRSKNEKHNIAFWASFSQMMACMVLETMYCAILGYSLIVGSNQPIEAIINIKNWKIMFLSIIVLLVAIAKLVSRKCVALINVDKPKKKDSAGVTLIYLLIPLCLVLFRAFPDTFFGNFSVLFATLPFFIAELAFFSLIGYQKLKKNTSIETQEIQKNHSGYEWL